jgi:hypothetical protein
MKKTIIEYFYDFLKRSKEVKCTKEKILESVNSEYEKYKKMPQLEKDLLSIELARSLGCQSHDLESCAIYLRNFIRSIQ